MGDPIDIIKIVKNLPSRPRGRACAVLTHNYYEQKKWAGELARQTDSDHVNLLDLFLRNESLIRCLGEFLVPRLFEFLKHQSRKPILIVSGMEFLKATWVGQDNAVEQFASYIETWNQTPCLLFVLQHDKRIATRQFRRFPQYPFVIDQKETLAL